MGMIYGSNLLAHTPGETSTALFPCCYKEDGEGEKKQQLDSCPCVLPRQKRTNLCPPVTS